MPKSRKITDAEKNLIIARGVCPVCHGHLVIKLRKWGQPDEETGKRGKFLGEYYVCAGHESDWDHFNLSPGGGKRNAPAYVTPTDVKIRR